MITRLRQRVALWAYRSERFDLALRLSPSVYWSETARAALAAAQHGADRRGRELRGDD